MGLTKGEMRYAARGETAVRHKTLTVVWAFILGVICAAAPFGQGAAGGDQFLGTWSGTWDGGGSSGGFELTIERAKDGPLAGKVSVTGEPSYQATLTQIVFDGTKMTARYDFTPQPGGEVLLAATFDGGSASGTWALREKASGTEYISGNWNVKKK